MSTEISDSQRYPIGRFQRPAQYDAGALPDWIQSIAQLPETLAALLATMPAGSLEVPYREGGWNTRQLIHHLADSHMNAFIRFQLAITEEEPVIKPYLENRWAEQPVYALAPEVSLQLLRALHARWTYLLQHLETAQWSRVYIHPEFGKRFALYEVLALYAWHGQHHTAHIRLARKAAGLSHS